MPKMVQIYEILLPLPFGHGFSYFGDEDLALEIGDVVKVPFRGRETHGMVLKEGNFNGFDEKKIKHIIGHSVLKLDAKLVEFIRWVANHNMAPQGLILKLAIATLNNSKEPKKPRKQKPEKSIKINLKELNEQQKEAADFLNSKIDENKFSATLLDGVTGSGKTEVYFQNIAHILQNSAKVEKMIDAQILILLPEITLTSQLCSRFEERFGIEASLWHSKISPAKKRDLFWQITSGKCRVLIGARSALFLPFKNLQLIIADEEHDASFKQEDVVNYQGRNMAVMRAKMENIPIILSSATPSLESFVNAQNGKYHLLQLQSRFGQKQKTNVRIIDMRQEKLPSGQFISAPLQKALQENLAQKKQSLLFLNRRGYAPLTLCRACGVKVECRNCSSYLTLHHKINRLICHHCGFGQRTPKNCQSCGAEDKMASCGVGVEKLQEQVQEMLPEAKIGLMTSDAIKTIKDAQNLLEEILAGEIDIIIGTQMIAKGHHFPALSLVGIIDGDGSFLGGSLRVAERSFQLLTQVIGRAGRGNFAGEVILQSFNPQNAVFDNILNGNKEDFLNNEIATRQQLGLPPFAKMALIIFSGNDENLVIKSAKETVKNFPINPKVSIFGPAPMPITRVKNRFHHCLNVKVDLTVNLQKLIKDTLTRCNIAGGVMVKVDIDPN
jgi:primosomal protein N' (replication factor Y) (superfamily II helicase)